MAFMACHGAIRMMDVRVNDCTMCKTTTTTATKDKYSEDKSKNLKKKKKKQHKRRVMRDENQRKTCACNYASEIDLNAFALKYVNVYVIVLVHACA